MTTAKGSGITFIGQMFERAGRLVLGILFARFMGVEQYGLYSLASTALSIIASMSLLGLGLAVVRYVPIFAYRRDERALWGTLQIGLVIPFVVGLLAGISLFVFADPLAKFMFDEPRLVPSLRLAAFATPFSVLVAVTVSAMQGFKQMQYKVIAEDVFITLIKVILVAVLAFTGLNAVKAMAIHTAAVIIACIMLLYFLHKLFPLNRSLRAARFNTRQMLAFSLPVYSAQLIAMFGAHLQTILLGVLNTVVAAGIFTVASQINMIGSMFHTSIIAGVTPVVSELHSKGEREQMGRFYQTVTKWTFMFNLPLFLIILLFSGPILSIFGSSFVAGSTALVILSLGNLIYAATGITGEIITMTGHTWLNTANSVVVLALALAFNLWLIPTMGVVGAAIAAAVSTVVFNLAQLLEIYVLFRLLPYDKSFINPVTAGVVALATTWTITRWVFAGTGMISTIIKIGFFLATYAIMILLLGLSRQDRMVLDHLYRRLKAVLPGL